MGHTDVKSLAAILLTYFGHPDLAKVLFRLLGRLALIFFNQLHFGTSL
jgi:hypothetical protein